MITTKGIHVKLGKGRKLFSRVTTKDVDASIKVEIPKHRVVKGPVVSTNKLADVADIITKKKRDDIIAERKRFEKGDAVYRDDKGKLVTDEKREIPLEEFAERAGATINSRNIPIEHKKKKKLWKEMTDEEKKAAYQERAKKAKATREAKKKKGMKMK